ncbi:LacI family DNA-binding transcriptional regulator [Tessaracoccus antarcticus]|uniref:LacI family transcriptional regulator n=1 Tax=Tessaracoccus antarcticus TaxID=2479848 RepID=A0A3M0G5B9_9ACTN|nr:LacI family DNA-binding transcriptional regulator [Tessaracoccus antarcticus]RMB60034.1 LacI family transcriptional regulator [Tessaracoccus antarcticus]
MSGRPTLSSIASALGLSHQTVSNAINRPDALRPETLQRVLDEIARTGYVPSTAARQLASKRSRLFAFRVRPAPNGLHGQVVDNLLHAVTERAAAMGYHLLVFAAQDDADEVAQIERLRATSNIDGVVLTDTTSQDIRPGRLTRTGIPLVAFGRPWGQDSSHPWVDVDGAAGCRMATEQLLHRGAGRVGFLGWPQGSGVGDDRVSGWRQALVAAGAHDDGDRWLGRCLDEVSLARAMAHDLRADGVDALVCASDTLALGARAAFRESGLDTSRVVGFDDSPVAALTGLSSIRQPVEQVADFCVQRLLDADAVPRTRILEPTVVFRSGDFVT